MSKQRGRAELLLSVLSKYRSETNIYDDDYLKPTVYAFARTRNLLKSASDLVGYSFPEGTLFPVGDGGVRIEWEMNNRHLHLMIASEEGESEYLYHQDATSYKAEYDVKPELLAQYIMWLAEA